MGQRECSSIPGVCGEELHGQILELGVSQLPIEIRDFIIKTTLCETTDISLTLSFFISFRGNKIVNKSCHLNFLDKIIVGYLN